MNVRIWFVSVISLLPVFLLAGRIVDYDDVLTDNGFIGPWPLQLHKARSTDIEWTEQTGYFSFKATGATPTVYTLPLIGGLPEEYNVLSFEYFATDYLDKLTIALLDAGGNERQLDTSLGIREGWSLHSISLAQIKDSWGKAGDYLRISLGDKRGYVLNIRNLHLRAPTAIEKKRNKEKAKNQASERHLLALMNSYLSASFGSQVTRVEVGKDVLTINGQAGNQDSLFLAEIPLWMDAYALDDITHIVPLGSGEVFERKVERFNPLGDDRALSRWMVTKKVGGRLTAQSHIRYPDSIYTANQYGEERPSNRKGLADFDASRPKMIEDLDSLDITSVNVNFWSREILRSKRDSATLAHVYNGRTFYINADWLEKMDATIMEATKRDIIVSAIILIDHPAVTPDKEIASLLPHPDYDPSGIYTMPDLTTKEGMIHYAAILDFLASRYGRLDKKYGRIHHWIAHNEISAGWVWTNIGEKHPRRYMDVYHKSMRAIYCIARQYNPHAKVFISLDHHWDQVSDPQFYPATVLLATLLEFSRKEGDFEWGIAYHPFPESLFEPKSWLDKRVDYTYRSPLITFKNIEVLDAWTKQPATFFRGIKRRTIHFSEQGPNSRTYSPGDLAEQAASLAYVWKKMKALDGIETFQYHFWRDFRGEGGLQLGLRRFPDDEDPSGRKPIWYLYQSLDTPKEDEACAFARPIIGVKNWEEVIYKGDVLE